MRSPRATDVDIKSSRDQRRLPLPIPSYNMSFEQVLAADKSMVFGAILTAIGAFYMKHPELSFQDIEKMLRQHRCRTFLIARTKHDNPQLITIAGEKRTNPPNSTPMDLRTQKATPYYIWISTLTGRALEKEITAESTNYAENLSKLAFTGQLVVESSDVQSTKTTCACCSLAATTRCSSCDAIEYCSVSCRKKDFKEHRKTCRTSRSRYQKVEDDLSSKYISAMQKYENHAFCCEDGWRTFCRWMDMICVKRAGRDVVVCESCLARLGVTNRERVNLVNCRI
jgi:MYND finger protein